MRSRYFTPAALSYLYLNGSQMDAVILLLKQAAPPLQITALHLLEMSERLRESKRAAELWQLDRQAGYFEVVEVSLGNLTQRAESLAASTERRVPPLDWLHLAAAFELDCEEYVDFDPVVRAAARALGLSVLPCEDGSTQRV